MQNVRDYLTVKLHTSSKSALKSISSPTFKNYTILGEDLVQTNHFTPTVVHDKPIAIGFSILELVIIKTSKSLIPPCDRFIFKTMTLSCH